MTVASLQRKLTLLLGQLQNPFRLVLNTALVFAGTGLLKIANAAIFVFVTHRLATTLAGQYSTATTLVAIMLNLALFGLDEVLVREMPGHPRPLELFINLLVTRVLLALFWVTTTNVALYTIEFYPPSLMSLVGLLSIGQIGDAIWLLCQALFTSFGRSRYIVSVAAVTSVLRVVAGGWLIYQDVGIQRLVLLVSLTNVFGSMLALWLAVHRVFRVRFRDLLQWFTQAHLIRDTLNRIRTGGNFFLITVVVILEFQIDIILLSKLGTSEDVAIYSSAQTLMIGAWLLPQAFRAIIYRELAQAYHFSLVQLKRHTFRLIQTAFWFGGGVSLVLALASPFLINVIYPPNYARSAVVLQILAAPLLVAFISAPISRALLTMRKESVALICLSISLLTNIIFNSILIPSFGPLGSATARAISTLVFLLVSFAGLLMSFRRA